MWIVRLALRRPYTIAVACSLVFIFGLLSVSRMKTDILPAIDIPVVIVVWNYPGLSAEDMERRVVFISERAYSTTVSGISRIDSQSMTSLGILKVWFEPGSDIGGAIAQIVAVSLTASRIMPPGITPPAIVRYNASNVPVAQLTVSSKTLSEEQLFDYGLNFIRLRLFTIPGLATPAPYGGKQRQIMVDIDPARVAAKGLSPNDVVQAVLQSNVLVPAGAAQIGGRQYDVKLNSSPLSVAAFNDMPVRAVNGATVVLGDVARVRDGFAVQENVVRLNGRRATYLAILKKADASTLAVVEGAREQIPIIKQAAPEGMELKLDFDQSVFVRAAIMNVLHEAVIASILVSLMILFFLGSWRGAVIVGTSIPLAILVGLIGLFLSGNTLNLMTMGGLALAIGMLVDDATVAIESIHRNRHEGKALTPAILDGSEQIAVPALAATLTICIVFFPVVLLEGPARFLFSPLALGVAVSMLASYVLSRTLVPMLARMLMEKEDLHYQGESFAARFNRWRDRSFGRFQDAYGRMLQVLLHHRAMVLGAGAMIALCSATLPFMVGLDFFPNVDAGQMRLHFRAPIGTQLEETERLVARLEQRIQDIVPRDLDTINANIGMPISYNLAFVQTDNTGSQDADVLIALKPGHAPTERYMEKIRRELPDEFPGCALYFQPADIVSQVLNFGLSAPIDVQIEGTDVEKSYALARDLANRIRLVPGASDVRIPQVLAHPALAVDVDRRLAAHIGVTERDVANNLLVSLSSSALVAPSFWINPRNNVNYAVVVQTPLTKVDSVASLLGTPLGRGAQLISSSSMPGDPVSGGASYLGAVARLRPDTDVSMINHVAVQRVIDVQVSATGRDLGGVALGIQKAIDSLGQLPKATRIHIRGQSESMFAAFGRLGLGLVLAIVLVYLLLVVLFQSFLDPFIILVAVPGALIGVLWMLALTGTTLNVESFMGAIMAVGIATSNSILLVSAANDARVHEKLGVLEAVITAGRTRLRPVLMTALAMLLGMVPMALALGEGGEQNAPLGRAVIGGLLVATFVTLFVVPAVYTILRRAMPQAHQLDEKFEAESRMEPTHG